MQTTRSRRVTAPTPVSSLALLALALTAAAACSREPAPSGAAPPDAAGVAPAALALTVRADATGLLFRYYDPEARAMKTARAVDDVPPVARARVIVHTERALLDYRAGEPLTVADLRAPGPDGTFPSERVDPYAFEAGLPQARRPSAAPPAPAADGAGSSAIPAVAGVGPDDVLLFSTDWCPHCRRARDFLKRRGVAFTERDLEKDPRARPLLAELGRAAGVDPALLGSVPVLWVRGRLLLGFDEGAVARLLAP
jgi:glutaredoxin